MKIGSSCKDCVFNVSGFDDNQNGCKLGVLNAISQESKVFELVDGNYQFDRVCALKSTKDKDIGQVWDDSYLRFHFIIIDTELDQTLNTLDSISDLVNSNSMVAVVTTDNFADIYDHIKDKNNYFVTNSYEEKTSEELIDECFHKMKNGYTIVLHSGETVTQKDLNQINNLVNWEFKRLALVNNSPFVINNVIFKLLKGNKHGSFKDKLDEISEIQTIKSMVYTWEEVDEIINS